MSNIQVDYTGLPLFQSVANRNCETCFGTSMFLSPVNTVEACPKLQFLSHPSPNEASLKLLNSVKLLSDRRIWKTPLAFDLARLLTNFNKNYPCPRQEIFETFYDATALSYPNQLRKFHALVEELRNNWLMPIGSRKTEPSGYWIITDLDDYKEWFRRATSAPITQLSTIHKNARHNFPVFAEQIQLEFFTDAE